MISKGTQTILAAAAVLGVDCYSLFGNKPNRPEPKPDPEAINKAEEKRARKRAKRLKTA